MTDKLIDDSNLDSKLITSEDVLTMLKSIGLVDVTIRTVDNMCRDGKLPFQKIGKRRYFRRATIAQTLNDMFAHT